MILVAYTAGGIFLKKNITGLVIVGLVLSILLPSFSLGILQKPSEDPKEPPDGPGKEDEDPNKYDKTPPVIIIDYLPLGDCTDGNPGAWDVFAYDDETGINYDTFKVYIDDILIGNSFGIYDCPCSLGDHSIQVEVINNDPKHPLLASSIDLISIIDDDIAPPELSNLIIDFDFESIIISLTAIDYSGIDEFQILINEVLIEPINIENVENKYIFVLKNQWVFESGTNNVEIHAYDADNDRENDGLSSSIYGTFDINIGDMYQFVIWKLEGVKCYINSNLESKFNNWLIRILSLAQYSLRKALCCFEMGEIRRSLFHGLRARTFLWVTENVLEKMNEITDADVKFLIIEFHNIRNFIVILMNIKKVNDPTYYMFFN